MGLWWIWGPPCSLTFVRRRRSMCLAFAVRSISSRRLSRSTALLLCARTRKGLLGGWLRWNGMSKGEPTNQPLNQPTNQLHPMFLDFLRRLQLGMCFDRDGTLALCFLTCLFRDREKSHVVSEAENIHDNVVPITNRRGLNLLHAESNHRSIFLVDSGGCAEECQSSSWYDPFGL